MNTEQTASQLELAAQILRTGHPFEALGGLWCKPLPTESNPITWIAKGMEIRLALATPPDNRPLHNPDNLTAEQVGAGWRLLVVGERQTRGYQYWASKKWSSGNALDDVVDVCNRNTTCRVPLSLPWPEVEKPATPPFQLPPPPPGMSWYRTDGWTAEMLPQGYRPLVEGEKLKPDDQGDYGDGFMTFFGGNEVMYPQYRYRTTRPLTFTHEGKTWTWHRPGDPMPCDKQKSVTVLYDDPVQEYNGTPCPAHCFAWKNPSGLTPIIGWRYAGEPKTVELGPEDVPPSSVFRGAGEISSNGWCLITSCSDAGIRYWRHSDLPGCGKAYPWSELRSNGTQINRSLPLTGRWNPDAWEPCSKQIAV